MSNYFNNDVVQGWIEEYLSYSEEERKEDPHALLLREKILVEVSKVVNGIIFTHKFTIWEPYDDLFQEAMEASIKALEKFNPNYITGAGKKATSFNYFSLVAKRCLKFYTIRNRKFRENSQIEDYTESLTSTEDVDELNETIISDDFIQQLNEVFSDQKVKKLAPLVDILKEYLQKIGHFNKRDFFRFSKSYGWSPNLIRKFLKIIRESRDVFYKSHEDRALKDE